MDKAERERRIADEQKLEAADDATRLADNGGHTHLRGAVDEFSELYFRNGEDSDGDPTDPANPNSAAYNRELTDSDEPMVDVDGHILSEDVDDTASVPRAGEPRPDDRS